MSRRGAPLMAALALALCSAASHAGDYGVKSTTRFPIPQRYVLVNDHIPLLRLATHTAIQKKLEALERRNGTRIVLLTVPHEGKDGLEAYARDVIREWNIGNNGHSTGVLVLVTHNGWHLAAGPAISGAIPDVTLARISRDVMAPAWTSDGDVSVAIARTIDALVAASMAEETAATNYDYANPHQPFTPQQFGAMGLGGVALAYGVTLLWLRRRRRPGAS